MSNYLSAEQLEFWKQNGYLKVTGFFSEEGKQELIAWTEDLQHRPETPGKWMKYYEAPVDNPEGKQLCRVEDFLTYHEGLEQLLKGEKIIGMLSELMNEPAVLFKEKINFKLPGGNGFTAHQDAPAFTSFNQHYHITMMVSIDASTIENGCLDMVPGLHNKGVLPTAPDGTLDAEFSKTLPWEPLTTNVGDIVFFDSYIPHRSFPNKSNTPRRALYITYNKASDGSYREQYFQKKREFFPPDIEKVPGKDYSNSGVFNIGNPVKTKS
jgi:hypothetical protein